MMRRTLVFGVMAAVALSCSNGPGGSTVDTAPIELPEKLGAFADFVSQLPEDAQEPEEFITRQANTATRTVEIYQKAFGGAAAAVRAYATDELEFIGTVIAIRASAPGLTPGVQSDPADVGLAAPIVDVKRFGEVDCLLRNPTTRENEELASEEVFYSYCQRTQVGLTVQVHGSFEGNEGRRVIVDLTNAAFESIAG